jgi:hypothetical protein
VGIGSAFGPIPCAISTNASRKFQTDLSIFPPQGYSDVGERLENDKTELDPTDN